MWTSDGTSGGTVQLRDINAGPGASLPTPLAVVGGRMLLSADDGVNRQEPWVTDGTALGTTLLVDLNTSPVIASPVTLASFQGELYFTASGALYRRDDVTGINARISSVGATAGTTSTTILDDSLYFTYGDATMAPALWKLDGTTGGLSLVKSVPAPTMTSASITSLTSVGGRLYFNGRNRADTNTGEDVYVSDGTAVGTIQLTGTTAYSRRTRRGHSRS